MTGSRKATSDSQHRRFMTLKSKWYHRGSRTLGIKWSKWQGRHPAQQSVRSRGIIRTAM
ncbi:hypothetical protein KIN20_008764 [Parelaphostrongylus tenuis]|uniref:Uncharacterized protein n=1 Tax=Parelaphostrongylus tenuis TaxID=148309 RepID=A0AAD5QK13_PARTN|nr:hypothetical protein KIN20_008764 [Parelaphostrongylus tenuis]